MLTPYLGQLRLLKGHLERHTVVHLEEGDAKLLDDLAENAAAAAAAGSSLPAGSLPEREMPPSVQAAEASATVKTSSLRSKLRLATVDNFQGALPAACSACTCKCLSSWQACQSL